MEQATIRYTGPTFSNAAAIFPNLEAVTQMLGDGYKPIGDERMTLVSRGFVGDDVLFEEENVSLYQNDAGSLVVARVVTGEPTIDDGTADGYIIYKVDNRIDKQIRG